MNISTAAVVVNYNGQKTIQACLDSLVGQSVRFSEILVVDNDSPDQSWKGLEEAFPGITILKLDHNQGFPAACNAGIANSRSELIAILNNDIVLDPDWLKQMLSQVSPGWDFWASRVLFADRPGETDSAGDGMTVIGAGYKKGHRQPADQFQREEETFGACAAAALYRRNLLAGTNGFDQDFFLIYEDADLSFRARLLGYRCLYVPRAVVYHRVNYSIGTFSENYVYYGQRNSEAVFWKNMPGPLLCLYLPERLLFDLLSLCYFTWKGRLIPFLRAKIDFIRGFRQVWKKRKSIQRNRRLGCKQLRRVLDRNWVQGRLKG